MYTHSFLSPLGPLTLYADEAALKRLVFAPPAETANPSPLVKEAIRQLQAYFSGDLKEFSLPLAPEGTAFQQAVWRALLHIPYGTLAAYSQIAGQMGRPGAARAVGMACHVNPLPIFIPCHRVVGKNGSLTGYAPGLTLKEYLLRLEGAL